MCYVSEFGQAKMASVRESVLVTLSEGKEEEKKKDARQVPVGVELSKEEVEHRIRKGMPPALRTVPGNMLMPLE